MKTLVIAIIFVAGCAALETYLFKFNYLGYFKRLRKEFNLKRMLIGLGGIAASFSLSVIFVWVSLISIYPFKIIYGLIFSIGLLVEYTARKGYGRFSIPADYIDATYADRDLWLDSIFAYLNLIALLPISIYVLLVIIFKPVTLFSGWYFIALCGAIILVHWPMARFIKQGTFPTFSLSAFFRTLFFLPRHLGKSIKREPLSFSFSHADKNIVLIVDESVRPDHLSLNGYERQTTHFLEELQAQGIIFNWGACLSGGHGSIGSNRNLLAGIRIGDPENAETNPSIFQFAKAMGYQTYYFDGWGPNFWLGKPDDLRDIDHWVKAFNFREIETCDIDTAIAQAIKKVITTSTGNFVWVSKRGMHFDYNRCFPGNKAEWNPLWISGQDLKQLTPEKQRWLVNSYDNALHYNLNNFFAELFSREFIDTVFIYTSDHGQTLSENGEHWTHGRGTPHERNVPLFIISQKKLEFNLNLSNPSHANIFPTLLDLMSVPQEHRKYRYSPSLISNGPG